MKLESKIVSTNSHSRMIGDEDGQSDALRIGDYITLKEMVNDGYMSAEGMSMVF